MKNRDIYSSDKITDEARTWYQQVVEASGLDFNDWLDTDIGEEVPYEECTKIQQG